MPKLVAHELDLESVTAFIDRHRELRHLRARKRSDTITLESGPKSDPIKHMRFRKVTRQWWTVEMATHTGRWELTPFREPLLPLIEFVASSFPWLLVPRE
jgi:hypothetical protein